MEWLIQGLITAFICCIIRYVWEKIKHYINSSSSTIEQQNKQNFTPLKLLKKQFFISLSMVIIPIVCFAFFKNFLIQQRELLCTLFIILFFGILVFWGVIEEMFIEISYYRNNNNANNKSQTKQK